MFSGTGLEQLLERHLGYDHLEDARIPVEVTATDLVTGDGRILGTGPSVSAVRASAAVPGVLPPVTRDGKTLVDGADRRHRRRWPMRPERRRRTSTCCPPATPAPGPPPGRPSASP